MPTPNDQWGHAPNEETFVAMAQAALDRFEPPFKELAASVSIRISDFADEETLEALHIDDPYALTGLYSGVALTLDAISAPSQHPPLVWLYRLPIIDEWATRGDIALEDLVAHVLIHELGHHFGWSDEDMDAVLASPD